MTFLRRPNFDVDFFFIMFFIFITKKIIEKLALTLL